MTTASDNSNDNALLNMSIGTAYAIIEAAYEGQRVNDNMLQAAYYIADQQATQHFGSRNMMGSDRIIYTSSLIPNGIEEQPGNLPFVAPLAGSCTTTSPTEEGEIFDDQDDIDDAMVWIATSTCIEYQYFPEYMDWEWS